MGICICKHPNTSPAEKNSICIEGYSPMTTISKVRTTLSNSNLSTISIKNKPILTKLLKRKRIHSQTNIKSSQLQLSKN